VGALHPNRDRTDKQAELKANQELQSPDQQDNTKEKTARSEKGNQLQQARHAWCPFEESAFYNKVEETL